MSLFHTGMQIICEQNFYIQWRKILFLLWHYTFSSRHVIGIWRTKWRCWCFTEDVTSTKKITLETKNSISFFTYDIKPKLFSRNYSVIDLALIFTWVGAGSSFGLLLLPEQPTLLYGALLLPPFFVFLTEKNTAL